MGMINNIFYFGVGYYIGKNYSTKIETFIENNVDVNTIDTIHKIIQKIFSEHDK